MLSKHGSEVSSLKKKESIFAIIYIINEWCICNNRKTQFYSRIKHNKARKLFSWQACFEPVQCCSHHYLNNSIWFDASGLLAMKQDQPCLEVIKNIFNKNHNFIAKRVQMKPIVILFLYNFRFANGSFKLPNLLVFQNIC